MPRFAGWHWSNPPDLMDVVEICPGAETDPAVIAELVAFTEGLGKAPAVLRRPVPGYLLNRLQYALMREAWNLVESGVCDFADIDRAVTYGLGLRWAAIGPFEVQDVAGLDVHLAVASSLMPELGGPREPPERLRELVARGERGLATGSGLLGRWDAARAAEVLARRERVMRAVQAARVEACDDSCTFGAGFVLGSDPDTRELWGQTPTLTHAPTTAHIARRSTTGARSVAGSVLLRAVRCVPDA